MREHLKELGHEIIDGIMEYAEIIGLMLGLAGVYGAYKLVDWVVG